MATKVILTIYRILGTEPVNELQVGQLTAVLELGALSLSNDSTRRVQLLRMVAYLRWEKYQRQENLDDLDRTIFAEKRMLELISRSDPNMLEWLDRLGRSYRYKFERRGQPQDIHKAIGYYEQAAAIAPDDYPDTHRWLNNIAISYRMLFNLHGGLEQLEQSVIWGERAIHLAPGGHPGKIMELSNLACAYQCFYEQLDRLQDLEKAVGCLEQVAILASDDHPLRSHWLMTLGRLRDSLADRRGKPEDIEGAIECHKQALKLTGNVSTGRSPLLVIIGESYVRLWERLGRAEDIDAAVAYHEQAVLITPEDHPTKPLCLSSLGNSYHARYQHLGRLQDINGAINSQEQAVRLTPNGNLAKPTVLNNLGIAYHTLFDRLGKLEDLHSAINCLEQAVSLTPDGDDNKSGWLSNLANTHHSLFKRLEKIEAINRAILYQTEVVRLTPEGHPKQPHFLSNLGIYYRARFLRLGKVDDVDQAISCQDRAARLTPQGHSERARWLNELGSTCLALFNRLGNLVDLDKSVLCLREAVHLTPDSHPEKPRRLENLGDAHDSLFKQLGRLQDVYHLVKCLEHAVLLAPDNHPHRPRQLGKLGGAYITVFEHSGNLADIQRGVHHLEQAAHLIPDDHPEKPMILFNLGTSYLRICPLTRNPLHVNEGLLCLEKSLLLTPENHPSRVNIQLALGHCCDLVFKCSGDSRDRLNAMECFKEASSVSTAHPSTRLKASLAWARTSTSPLEAYAESMTLLPQVVWRGVSITRRYECLASDVGDVVTEAAAAAILFCQHCLAVEWLEEGRSMVWNQMLQLRTPLDTLFATNPSLATQLKQVAFDLEQASAPHSTLVASGLDAPSLQQAAQKHRHLAERWDELLGQVRDVPGFQNFLRPKPFSELMPTARTGTIVVINVHSSRCDAIALPPGLETTQHIPLPNLSVKKVLDAQGLCQDELPHITWCTTGPLAFLPLHAAGNYDQPHARIFNYVVSSYTPTLSALCRPAPTPSNFRGILAVGQAASVGTSPLPGTVVELDKVEETTSQLPFTRLEGSRATTSAVLSAMEKHSWVHLACHASQDVSEPTASSFQLHDGGLSLAAITRKELQHADFAFLSACQTAMGYDKLPDESVHLAAGMLMVGFKSVVATMWSIKDQDAPLVAEKVYSYMLAGKVPDSSRAAEALHKSVASLRDTIGETEFARWVPYIHMGC
ncbi:hypothetical protein FRC06_001797 [Ceratobasidium sp. 370]|nr:hypothetical protein FRC06_001797 [Ceratobasidium sp. 370]